MDGEHLEDGGMLQVRNEKARRFLLNMRKKPGVRFEHYFPKADKGALRLLKLMLSFDPVQRPTSEEALADPYFAGLSQPGREPSAQPVSKLAFDFERRKLQSNEVCCVANRQMQLPWLTPAPEVGCATLGRSSMVRVWLANNCKRNDW